MAAVTICSDFGAQENKDCHRFHCPHLFAMAPGSVIVDLAAEHGGNCELTKENQTVVAHGVTIIGEGNLTSMVPYHASQMYSKNIATFLLHLVKKGELTLDSEDEITRETMLTRDGNIVHARVREILGPLAGRRVEET